MCGCIFCFSNIIIIINSGVRTINLNLPVTILHVWNLLASLILKTYSKFAQNCSYWILSYIAPYNPNNNYLLYLPPSPYVPIYLIIYNEVTEY